MENDFINFLRNLDDSSLFYFYCLIDDILEERNINS